VHSEPPAATDDFKQRHAVLAACPSDEQLFAWASGAPTQEGDIAFERRHLMVCESCRSIVAELVRELRDSEADSAGALSDGQNVVIVPSETTELGVAPETALDSRPDFGDEYRIERALGRGGMGVVYLAYEPSAKRHVAIKVVRSTLANVVNVRERLFREARIVEQLPADCIARPLKTGTLPTGEPFFVMEALQGEDLAARMARGRLSEDEVAAAFLAMARVLATAHRVGVVHRDIKPSNIFVLDRPVSDIAGSVGVLNSNGSASFTGSIRLLDFGLSKWRNHDWTHADSLTQESSMMGTPAYMAPEQIRDPKAASFASDVWSLGVICIEMLTGLHPFLRANLGATLAAVLTDPVPLDELPPKFASVLAGCLDRDPSKRWANADELLRGWAQTVFTSAALATTVPRQAVVPQPAVVASATTSRRSPATNRLGALLGAGLAVMFTGIGGLWLLRSEGGAGQPTQTPVAAVSSVSAASVLAPATMNAAISVTTPVLPLPSVGGLPSTSAAALTSQVRTAQMAVPGAKPYTAGLASAPARKTDPSASLAPAAIRVASEVGSIASSSAAPVATIGTDDRVLGGRR
jgi:eukaryotic-like serine/threonine-protein kinase